jgi:hypothetical protein
MRIVLTCWGAAAAGLIAVEFTRAGVWGSVGPEWTLTFLATYFAGLWAIRAEPGNGAAVRLLVFGCVALTFLAASLELIIQLQAGLVGIGYVLGNAVVQMISFGFVVAQVAALVRYPNGVPRLGGALVGRCAVDHCGDSADLAVDHSSRRRPGLDRAVQR